jgi:hypothetical protein
VAVVEADVANNHGEGGHDDENDEDTAILLVVL